MTPLPLARKATAALLVGAFALSACGGGSPTAAPPTTTATQAAPSTAATTPPASQSVVTLPPGTEPPAATGGPAVDPADDLKIAAPYTLEPAAALELLENGAWKGTGVIGPEALPPQPFLDSLDEYGAPHGLREYGP